MNKDLMTETWKTIYDLHILKEYQNTTLKPYNSQVNFKLLPKHTKYEQQKIFSSLSMETII